MSCQVNYIVTILKIEFSKKKKYDSWKVYNLHIFFLSRKHSNQYQLRRSEDAMCED